MEDKIILRNAETLQKELEWLNQLISERFSLYFQQQVTSGSLQHIRPPDLSNDTSNYARFVNQYNLNFAERMVLVLALCPHVRPDLLDGFFARNSTYDKPFTEFGGYLGKSHKGMLPTGETALFLFGGTDIKLRLLIQYIFSGDFVFARQNVIYLESVDKSEPKWSSRLMISREYLDYFTHGNLIKPDFSPDFPARYTTTQMEWEDLVLPAATARQVNEIRDWLQYGDTIMSDPQLGKMLKPGYKCLFYGPPGTGKTLTASLLGKVTGRDVYKIDLSLMVSKYIGETEKNMAKVFDQAENQNWILFFDEADALFGTRTEAKSANDRFANQEVAYLLQRIEDFPGVAILASNLKDNIDTAFSRRFQSCIQFQLPGRQERQRLWEQSFSADYPPSEEIDLAEVSEKYPLSGGLMMNVIRYCTLMTVKNKEMKISPEYLERGIRREMEKEGVLLI
ncbi:MAG: ATP-binding protein [Bacteroidota bacterium]